MVCKHSEKFVQIYKSTFTFGIRWVKMNKTIYF